MKSIYIVKANSDMTEGRGPMIAIAHFDDEDKAIEFVKTKRGIMGRGPGGADHEVVRVNLVEREDEPSRYDWRETKVWGHRTDWRGKWSYGYLDNRDAPTNDPEFQEFLRLKEKFGV